MPPVRSTPIVAPLGTPRSGPGLVDALWLLAQLLAQLLAFLGRQLTLDFACLGRLVLGLQGIAQIGPALITLGLCVGRARDLGASLRQCVRREADKANQPEKGVHVQNLRRCRAP